MRKEILFAIVAGAAFGLVIAFGIWRANSQVKPIVSTEDSSQEATPQPSDQIGLTLAKPENYEVFSQNRTEISGITKENSWVAISTESQDFVLKSDENGEFNQEIPLIGGVNEIVVTAFDVDGTKTTENILIVYSSEFDQNKTEEEKDEN